MTSEFARIGVVGGGIMGTGIAEVCARAGINVVVAEIDPQGAAAVPDRIAASLQRAVSRGKLDEAERAAALERVRVTSDLGELADRQLVVEAIVESEGEKVEVFGQLDKLVEDPEAILASNTSSIPIMKLATSTNRREHVVGLHFFNPVPVIRLVELVPSLLTSEETLDRVRRFATEGLGKQVIQATDRAGFIVNALLVPYILSAIRMVESGFASAEDIDTGMVIGTNHPMGPLALGDLVGLDTINAIAEALYEEFKEQQYAAPPLLQRMLEAGLLGRKTGRGFYTYED